MLCFQFFLVRAVVHIDHIQQCVKADLIRDQYETTGEDKLGCERIKPSNVRNITKDVEQIKQRI